MTGKPFRILIVDDDQSILKGLTVIIRKFEFTELCETICCDNASDAIEILISGGVDLVITDLEMPGTGGLDFIKEARVRNICNNFIILTGYADFEFARQAISYQVSGYLLKPVDKKELYGLINKQIALKSGSNVREETKLPDLEFFRITDRSKPCSSKMQKIISFIDKNYNIDLSLSYLSETLHITSSYICTMFQQEMNTTFLLYLDCVRIKESARLLLENQEEIIRDIAVKSGFMNERHFYKVFRKRLGMTPGEFRSKYSII